MWKRFDDNIVAELNKINAYINLEILIVLPERNDCCWRWLKLFLIVKGTANARNLKRNLQFHSLQLNGELESYIRKQKKKVMLLLTTIPLLLEFQYTRQDFQSLLGCLFSEE